MQQLFLPEISNVPPLTNGDHLSRAEFERRYHAMPALKKAELIEGVVYMPSPLRLRQHAKPHGLIMAWLVGYAGSVPNVEWGDAPTVRLDQDNEPQPDAILRLIENGSSRISADDYIEGAPELVVEIAASSVSMDMHSKLNVYRRNGVQEYLVWKVTEQAVSWFSLQSGTDTTLLPDEEGILKSLVFPGLWLNVPALIEAQVTEVLATLQMGILS
ncbi:MAG: Uma2 family endonuclease [Cyanophyceae cyanobacterium]